jgi:hypothetical protein
MTEMTKNKRTMAEIDKFMWIPSSLNVGPNNKRYTAIIEVARRLPNDAVVTLEEKVDSFDWFIPDDECLAGVFPFPLTYEGPPTEGKFRERYAEVLYLSPELERKDFGIAVASIAHELAHICLDHKPLGSPPELYRAKEKAAWKQVAAWGFGREAREHKQFYKQREK